MVTDQNSESQLFDNGTILQDNRILVNDDLRNNANLLTSRILQENVHPDSNLLQDRILLTDPSISEHNRPIIIHSNSDANQNFNDRSVLLENCTRTENRRNGNDLLLVKNTEFDKNQLLHLGFNSNLEMQLPQRQNLDTVICENSIDGIQTVYTNLQNVPNSKKRKLSQESPCVKSEPGLNLFTLVLPILSVCF